MHYNFNGEAMKEIRKEQLGMNQTELAELLGVEQTTISAIERNLFNPNIDILIKFMGLLNYSQRKEFANVLIDSAKESIFIRKTHVLQIAL